MWSPAVLLLALIPASVLLEDEVELTWKKRSYALAEFPEELTDVHRATIGAWGEWALAHEYHLTLDPTRRVLLVHERPTKYLRRELRFVAEVLAFADRLFPEPEDAAATRLLPGEWTSGATHSAVPDELPVLLIAKNVADYAAVLDTVAARNDYLADWTAVAKSQAGFVLSQPLLGAWLADGEGLEEWSPDGELINRLTRMLLLQRFGRLPEWLSQGLAWQAEMELHKGIYCFPNRAEFVYASEHSGWGSLLANRFENRAQEPVTIEELCALTRTRFDSDAAIVGWGGASFLALHHAEAFPLLLADLVEERERKGRIQHGVTSWESDKRDAPPEVQLEFLHERIGEDVLVEMTEYFRRGKRYRK